MKFRHCAHQGGPIKVTAIIYNGITISSVIFIVSKNTLWQHGADKYKEK